MCDLCGCICEPHKQFCQHSLCSYCYNLIYNTTKQCPFCNRKITNNLNYDKQVQLDSMYVNPQQFEFDDVFCSVHCDMKASYFDAQSNLFCCELCKLKYNSYVNVLAPTIEVVKEQINDEIRNLMGLFKQKLHQYAEISSNLMRSNDIDKENAQQLAQDTIQTLLKFQEQFGEVQDCEYVNVLNVYLKNHNYSSTYNYFHEKLLKHTNSMKSASYDNNTQNRIFNTRNRNRDFVSSFSESISDFMDSIDREIRESPHSEHIRPLERTSSDTDRAETSFDFTTPQIDHEDATMVLRQQTSVPQQPRDFVIDDSSSDDVSQVRSVVHSEIDSDYSIYSDQNSYSTEKPQIVCEEQYVDRVFKVQLEDAEFLGSHLVIRLNENFCFSLSGTVIQYQKRKSLIGEISQFRNGKEFATLFNGKCTPIEFDGNVFVDLQNQIDRFKYEQYLAFRIDMIKTQQIVKEYYENQLKQYLRSDTAQIIAESGLCLANKVHGSKLEQILVELYKQYQTKIIRNENNFERLTVDNWASGQFVVRNPESWAYKKQDVSEYEFQSGNTKYYLGVLESVNAENKTAIVIWMNKDRNIYSIGKKNKFDLLIFNDTTIIEKVLYNVGQPNLSESHTPGCKCSIGVQNQILWLFNIFHAASDLQSKQDPNLLCKSGMLLFQEQKCYTTITKLKYQETSQLLFQSQKMIKAENAIIKRGQQKVVKYDHRSESYQIAPFMKPHINFIKSSFTPSFAGPVVTSFDKPVVICIGQEWIFDITNKIGILHKYNSSSMDIQWKIEVNMLEKHKYKGYVQAVVTTYNIHENTFPIHYYEHFVTPNNFQHHRLVGPTRFSKMKQLFGVLEAKYVDTALVKWSGGDQTICHIGINGDLTYLGGW
ncbi:Mib_herc2_domain-containing protein [Hexamita inflata]|uniref:Mib_herc2 domain-containing protein n=1 Tax=Hexamita inflata TaxID=28002 RepID=A0AA86UWU9_9EUKA|nr:Mib_herc2 domain-containing protein [Hexamita inflata]